MQVESPTDMVVMLAPSSDFDSVSEDRVLKLSFPGNAGDWCITENSLDVIGVDSSAVDYEEWTIDEVLPGSLTANCFQDESGDYIKIEGLDALSSGLGYGVRIGNNPEVFSTTSELGEHIVVMELEEGDQRELLAFKINLLESDDILISAMVSDTISIICTLEEDSVDFGVLYKGGVYSNSSFGITTESTEAFYWAVYGQGGPDTANAGLYNSEGGGYLLSSLGIEGRVNLITGEGFGMVVDTSEGNVPDDFSSEEVGIFGAIGKGTEQAKLFLYSSPTEEIVNTQVTYGARASSLALTGPYSETLTYVCGGYLGE